MTQRRRIAYLVSRFPAVSETFVIRELNEVEASGEFELTLMSLLPSSEGVLHPNAVRWSAGLIRPGLGQALTASLWWFVRRPLRFTTTVGRVIAGTWRRPRRLWRSLATVPLAAAHARTVDERGIEHLHAHFASYPALAAWVCDRLCGVPYSFTAHAHDIFVDQSLLVTKVDDASFVIAISRFNRSFLERCCGESTTPVEVVHCGVNPELYPYRPRRVPARGLVRVLCVANLQAKKGHEVLLRALASGEPGLERLHLDLVGGGELRQQLERRAAELGVADRVRFHGPRSETEVVEFLARADLFVLPSIITPDGQMEGLPVVLIEALASGLPTVSTRISGITELIEDGRTGYLAEQGDASALAAALVRALSGGCLDLDAGRALIEREFDVRKSGARMAELLCHPPDSRAE